MRILSATERMCGAEGKKRTPVDKLPSAGERPPGRGLPIPCWGMPTGYISSFHLLTELFLVSGFFRSQQSFLMTVISIKQVPKPDQCVIRFKQHFCFQCRTIHFISGLGTWTLLVLLRTLASRWLKFSLVPQCYLICAWEETKMAA